MIKKLLTKRYGIRIVKKFIACAIITLEDYKNIICTIKAKKDVPDRFSSGCCKAISFINHDGCVYTIVSEYMMHSGYPENFIFHKPMHCKSKKSKINSLQVRIDFLTKMIIDLS